MCFSIDASFESGRLGRLVNHGDTKSLLNAKMRAVAGPTGPTLCIFAIKYIKKGDQILYDYGVQVPWLIVSTYYLIYLLKFF